MLLRALALSLAALALPATAAAAACPGAADPCPYTASSQVGQATGGTLRFPQAVALDAAGNLYVGDQGSHAVQVFDPAGHFVRSVGVPGSRPGELSAVGALATAGDGSLLVADGADRVDRFGAAGALLGSFGSSDGDVGPFRFGGGRGNDAGAGGGLAVTGDTLFVADSGNDRILRFALDGSRGTQLVAPGVLAHPKGLAVRGSRLYVADDQHHRVLVLDTGGRMLASIGKGAGTAPGQLNFPYGVAVDAAGRVFVADDLNQRIVRFSTKPAYAYKARWGSYGTGPGQLAYPRGIAVDGAGSVYVADTGNDRVDVFDRGGSLLRSVGSSGRAPGQFNTPLGAGTDASGVTAVTDSVNGRLELLNGDGSIAAVWGSPNPGPTILPRPVAVAFDPAGDAYVLDQRRARIVVFSRATGQPTRTIASQGSGPGQLLDPSALAIDATGTITVADTGNERLARFGLDGSYTGSLTGVGKVRGVAATPGGERIYAANAANAIVVVGPAGEELARFGGTGVKVGKLNAPGQMALDAAGTLWVADRGNNRVQHFGADGQRLGAFGERGTGPGQFVYPTGVAVSCDGTLTVTDSSGNRVQRFVLTAPTVAPCRLLPPVATPPAPKSPTLPPPEGPGLSLRALRTTGLLTIRTVPARVGCDTACTVTLTATIAPRRAPAKGKKAVVVRLGPARAVLAAGASQIVRLTVTRAQARALRKKLGKATGLAVSLQAVATATLGSPTTVTTTVTGTR
ncbi:MAG: NHL repeat-containing protein [Solirubrobacteraceae bacterium]